ncbi:MAG: Spy/CpxP family protein refolding chaperone [Terracidiphilus sp.]|jgi:Spy/CpxP family protein refolding chaperone
MDTSMKAFFGRRILKAGLLVAGVMIAGVALAQEPAVGGGPGFGDHRPPFERALGANGDHPHWWNNQKMIDKLKLTDEQRKAMDATLLQHRATLIDLRASLQKAELNLEPLMSEDQPNESQILAQIDTVAQARAELEKANARFLLAIRSKLTPDQWKQLQADRASHAMGQRNWARGQGRGPGPGGQFQRQGAPPPPPGAGAPDGPQNLVGDGPGAGLPQ